MGDAGEGVSAAPSRDRRSTRDATSERTWSMPPLHRLLAVPAATLAAGAVAVDTVVFATTGHRTVITDDAAGSPVVSKILGCRSG